jgi:adenylate cyclase
MPKEIERKFLVDPAKFDVRKEQAAGRIIGIHWIEQGYVPAAPGWTVRVRRADEVGYITIKKDTDDVRVRHEFECEIPIKEANELLALASYRVSKTRYLWADGSMLDWVIDVFAEDNEGLIVMECEMPTSIHQIENMPPFTDKEVTQFAYYSNYMLGVNPYKTWKKPEAKPGVSPID